RLDDERRNALAQGDARGLEHRRDVGRGGAAAYQLVGAIVVVSRFQEMAHLFFTMGEMESQAGRLFDCDCFSQLGGSVSPLTRLAKRRRLAEQASRRSD